MQTGVGDLIHEILRTMGEAQEAVWHDWRQVSGAFRLGQERQDGWEVLVHPLLQYPVQARSPPRDRGNEDRCATAGDAAGFSQGLDPFCPFAEVIQGSQE